MPQLMKSSSTSNKKPGVRTDPFMAYNFRVEIGGMIVAGFSDVQGLSIETQVERKNFGGENDREYAFVTQTKFSDITLKRGFTNQDALWKWYMDVVKGRIQRKNGSICLLDHSGKSIVWWDFFNAFPIKWEGPTFAAASNAVAIETLVLTHQGLTMHQ